MSGEVVEVNGALKDKPELVNTTRTQLDGRDQAGADPAEADALLDADRSTEASCVG